MFSISYRRYIAIIIAFASIGFIIGIITARIIDQHAIIEPISALSTGHASPVATVHFDEFDLAHTFATHEAQTAGQGMEHEAHFAHFDRSNFANAHDGLFAHFDRFASRQGEVFV